MVVPVFLPHMGCVERCIYCHQGYITDAAETGLKARIDSALKGIDEPFEVGLFGGNIFGIEPPALERIFTSFDEYRELIRGFRISTKPVPLRSQTIQILKRNGVRIIELGIPTFNDAILAAMNRAHTAGDLFASYERLKGEGFTLVLQFMVGLPDETADDIAVTIENMVRLKPTGIRIYPLAVLRGTPLYDLYEKGEFIPAPFEEVLDRACLIYENAVRNGIFVINVGLTDNELVKGMVVDGFYHPAYGFLVQSRLFFKAVEGSLRAMGFPPRVTIVIHRNDIPLLVGYKRKNMANFTQMGVAVEWDASGRKEGTFEISSDTGRITASVF